MITADQKDKLKKYAEIKSQIKTWESEADALNPEILDIMTSNDLEEINLEEKGKLSLGARRTFKYPEEIKAKEEALKTEKKTAEQLGTAVETIKKYVIFKGLKDDETND